MLHRVISWSVRNKFVVLLLASMLTVAGVWSMRTTPLEALPDL